MNISFISSQVTRNSDKLILKKTLSLTRVMKQLQKWNNKNQNKAVSEKKYCEYDFYFDNMAENNQAPSWSEWKPYNGPSENFNPKLASTRPYFYMQDRDMRLFFITLMLFWWSLRFKWFSTYRFFKDYLM